MLEDLLIYKSDTFTQNGEDGIIDAIFKRIGTKTKVCCEFGAWDGIHLSNCRRLILDGWSALMIEGDETRFNDLLSNYSNNGLVKCVNKYVDAKHSSLGTILKENNIVTIDFLSVDIDGLDYEIFENLDVNPTVICIEVNAGHNPDSAVRLDRDIAMSNVGQPLQVFVDIASRKGYKLVCYTGNAFFVRDDIVEEYSLTVLSSSEAYQNFLKHLDKSAKEWLSLVNIGIVDPFYNFKNPYLAGGIGWLRTKWLKANYCLCLFIKNCMCKKRVDNNSQANN